MKRIWKLAAICFTAAMTLTTLASCEDKNDEGEGGETNINAGQAKEYLENTVTELLNLINPEEQKPAIECINYFAETFADFSFPAYEDRYETPAKKISADPNHEIIDIAYELSQNSGIYEPDYAKEEWVKVSDKTNGAELRYKDDAGRQCVITVDCEGDFWEGEGPIDGEYVEMKVPQIIKVNVKQAGTTMASGTINTNYTPGNAKIVSDITIANIREVEEFNGSGTEGTIAARVYVKNTVLAQTSARIQGKDLFNLTKWLENIDQEDEDAMLNSLYKASTSATLLNRITVKTDVNARALAVLNNLGMDSDTEQVARMAAAALNSNVTANLYFLDPNDPVGDITFQAYQEDSYYNEWGVRPVLTFMGEDAPVDIDSYLDDEKLEDLFEQIDDLIYTYEELLRFLFDEEEYY